MKHDKEMLSMAKHAIWGVSCVLMMSFFSMGMINAGPDTPLVMEVRCPDGLAVKLSGARSVQTMSFVNECYADHTPKEPQS